jgi:putative endonuclease
MFKVYLLYSRGSGKTYVGFTIDVERRIFEHNIRERKGFTLRYRPWTLIHTESFESKKEAMATEKFYKSGRGRIEIKAMVENFLRTELYVRYPPRAEKD